MAQSTFSRRVLIMGAAGRDFHNFNVAFRDDPETEVVAFTATQIPGIARRRYPASLAGPRYPDGIPILDEAELRTICTERKVNEVVFAYSDVKHEYVMHKASIALAAGADFTLLGPSRTMLQSRIPVIAVCAVRTGVGKSQVARFISCELKRRGIRVAVIRHPMPYGNLQAQAVQRFETSHDLDVAQCTIEEREEYEPHLSIGNLVYAGADYGRILDKAEREADVILWDGGNNDYPFFVPDLHIVLVDPLRPGDETTYYPGEAVLRMADVVIVAKANSASEANISRVAAAARSLTPSAEILRGESCITLDDAEAVRGKRVLVIEDGPTLTHGGMTYGAGYLAARAAGVREIVDPHKSAVGQIAEAFEQYPHIKEVLPALGYSSVELADLRDTINGSDAELVVSGTPSDLAHLIEIEKPLVRARYEFAGGEAQRLSQRLSSFLDARELGRQPQ
jgi:predicted GTPase